MKPAQLAALAGAAVVAYLVLRPRKNVDPPAPAPAFGSDPWFGAGGTARALPLDVHTFGPVALSLMRAPGDDPR